MKILYLTLWLPFPLSTGAKVRNYYLLKYLSGKNQIDLLTFIFNNDEENNISGLKDICKRVKVVRVEDKKYSIWEHFVALLSKKPRPIQFSFNREMYRLVSDWIMEWKYDVVIIDNLMAEYVLDIKNIPRIFDHHNIDAVISERDYQIQKFSMGKLRRWLIWWKGIKYEIRISKKIEAHTFVSIVDKKIMEKMSPGMDLLEVIPNGVDLNKFSYYGYEKDERDSSLIVFSSLLKYQANLEGLRYFCEKIFPIINKLQPNIKLKVTGDYSNLSIDDLRSNKNIEFIGYVDDVTKVISKAGVTIVPLRIGSGTRFKILESMALGTPVVSTSMGAEGIEGLVPVNSSTIHDSRFTVHDHNIWIADNPNDFAKGVLALLSDKELAGIISRNGRSLIEERYSWDNIGKKMGEFIKKVVKVHNPAP